MAAFNWPTTFQQPRQLQYTTALFPPPPPPPPPPQHLSSSSSSFHDNDFTFSDTLINNNPLFSFQSNHDNYLSTFNSNSNSVSFHNHNPHHFTYPTLSSSSYYNNPPMITSQQPLLRIPSPDLFSQFYDHQLIPNHVSPIMEEEHPLMVPNSFQGEESSVEPVVRKQSAGTDHGGERRLSAQSMAARVRRRKISDRTLQLGKLVPGAHRLNTAEMFQAAFKYVKFLQAQVRVLQLMGSSPEEEEEEEPSEELHALVTSRSVQEKLYGADKCIVTSRTLGESLAVHHQGINQG